MGYVDSILQPRESVLRIGKMHWIVYLRGGVAFVAGLLLLVWPVPGDAAFLLRIGGAVLALIGLYGLGKAWIDQWTTEIAVTNFRVIQKRGLIRRETSEMNMDKVESVQVDQSLLGRILGYGSIIVRGTGSGIDGLHQIADPLGLRSAIVVR